MRSIMKEDRTEKKEASKSLPRTIIIYLCSFLLVGAVVAGVVMARNSLENESEITVSETNTEAGKEQGGLSQIAEAIPGTEDNLTEEAQPIVDSNGDPLPYVPEIEAQVAKEEEQQEVQVGMSEAEMDTLLDNATRETETETLIDFATLQKTNKDVYAWIEVPGTVISYPILQHPTDNTHYLNYNLDGTYGYPGCIYTENFNNKEFTDPNTVIYGHNMKNGSMFAGLHKFEDSGFFDEHKEVIIYTPEKTLLYTIFAAYTYDDRHIMRSFNFGDPAVYEQYLKDIFARRDMSANIRTDMEVTKEDKIITLATCISKQPDKRLLVQAVLNK